MTILKKVKNSLSSWKKFYKAHILYIMGRPSDSHSEIIYFYRELLQASGFVTV